MTYVAGRDYYRTDVTVTERSGSAKPAVIYQYADCYLQDSDSGYGFYDATSGGIYCAKNANNSPADRIEGFVPLNSGSSYYEARYSTVRNAMDADGLPNTCECTILQDNGMALGFSVSLPAGGQVTRSFLVAFSPTGNAVDVVAPDVTLTSPANGSSTTDHTPTLAGGAGSQPGDSDTVTVNIYSGSSASGAAAHSIPVTRSGGSWSVRLAEPGERHVHGAGHSVGLRGQHRHERSRSPSPSATPPAHAAARRHRRLPHPAASRQSARR